MKKHNWNWRQVGNKRYCRCLKCGDIKLQGTNPPCAGKKRVIVVNKGFNTTAAAV